MKKLPTITSCYRLLFSPAILLGQKKEEPFFPYSATSPIWTIA